MTSSAGAYRRLRQPGAEIRLPRDPERRLRADRYFALPVENVEVEKRGGSNADDAAVGVSHR
jgi:hypothetical protein